MEKNGQTSSCSYHHSLRQEILKLEGKVLGLVWSEEKKRKSWGLVWSEEKKRETHTHTHTYMHIKWGRRRKLRERTCMALSQGETKF